MRSKFHILFLTLLAVLSLSLYTQVSRAATNCDPKTDSKCYSLLTPLPLPESGPINAGDPNASVDASQYIRGIVKLAIAAAGVIAVLKLVLAGFKYITSDSFTGKDTAKKDVQNAVLGLILAIAAVTILNTINPKLVDLGITIAPITETDAINDKGLCAGPVVDGQCTVQVGEPVPPDGRCAGPITADGICTAAPSSTGGAIAVGCTKNCVDAANFAFYADAKKPGGSCTPGKTPGDKGTCGGYACAGTSCYINQNLGGQLDDLDKLLATDGVKLQVSEMFPPTVYHKDDCHEPNTSQTGTCVDAVIFNASNDTVIKKFFADADKVFSSYEYEACPDNGSRMQHLKSILPASDAAKVKCESSTAGENVHINMK